MTLRYQVVLLSLALACGTSCQPAALSAAGMETPLGASSPVRGAATVAVRVAPDGPIRTQALARSFDDMAKIFVTLKDSSNAAVSSPGLTNPIVITLPAVDGAFAGVPPGDGYYVEAVAVDASGVSITENASSDGTASVSDSVVTYSSGTALTARITLQAATGSTDSSTSTITPATGTTLTFDQYEWMLLNNQSKATVASSMRSTTGPVSLTSVQPGALSGPTHEMWVFAGQTGTPNKALPVQPFYAPANATGTVPSPFDGTMSAVSLDTPTTTAVAAAFPLGVDDAGSVYYVDADTQAVTKLDAADTGTPYAAQVLFNEGALTGFAVDRTGNVYYSTGTGINVRRASDYGTAETLIGSTDVGLIALDEFGNLYWVKTSLSPPRLMYTQKRGTTYTTATEPVVLGDNHEYYTADMTGVTSLAADAYGNVYASFADTIRRYNRSNYGFWSDASYGPKTPTPVSGSRIVGDVIVSGAAGLSGFAVDRAGDVYFTQTGSNEVKLVPRNGANTTFYTVAGGGAVTTPGQTAIAGDPLTVAEFVAPASPAVTGKGVLFCTSLGDTGSLRVLRRIARP